MRSIYVWWDKNFREEFQRSLLNAIDHIIKLGEDFSHHFELKIFGNFSMGSGEYENADWYFNSSFEPRRKQVNARSVLDKCAVEPWQKQNPHIEIIGTSHDLWSGDSDNNFVYGMTRPGFGTLTSYNRMVKWYGPNAPLVYLILALHEDAHLVRAPDATRRRYLDYTLGAHCKLTDCTLGQVNVEGRPDALTAARNILRRYENTSNYFCRECTRDIVRGKRIETT